MGGKRTFGVSAQRAANAEDGTAPVAMRYGGMPRFFLHVHYGDEIASDDEGIEKADLQQAREEAVRGVRSIIAEDVLKGRASLGGRVVIMDEANSVVDTVSFADAVRITPS